MPSTSAGSLLPCCRAGAAPRCSKATTWSGGRPVSAPTRSRCRTIAACSAPSRAPTSWSRRPPVTPLAASSASGSSKRTARPGNQSACISAPSIIPRPSSCRTAASSRRTTRSVTDRPRFRERGRRTSGLQTGRSTLDLFGDCFALLNFTDQPTQALEIAAAQRGVPLKVHRIEHAEARALYGKALVLVRPDGHVAWRGDDEPEEPLALIDRVRGAA